MKENLHLKRGLIIQSLSPVFVLLIIRHLHLDYFHLIKSFFTHLETNPQGTVLKALGHPRFGEFLIIIVGLSWIVFSFISIPAFKATQNAGFVSKGEFAIEVSEEQDAAASFLMTFILPLLIDELSSPQYWISYILVIIVVYAVLYKTNFYYQSLILALLGYKVFKFKLLNPTGDLIEDKEYIGITRNKMIAADVAIMRKHIADNVYLVYNE